MNEHHAKVKPSSMLSSLTGEMSAQVEGLREKTGSIKTNRMAINKLEDHTGEEKY